MYLLLLQCSGLLTILEKFQRSDVSTCSALNLSRKLVTIDNISAHLRHMMYKYHTLHASHYTARNNQGKSASGISRMTLGIHVTVFCITNI